MRSFKTKSIAVIVIMAAIAAFFVAWVVFTARTDTITVTAIDEGYVIEITSAGYNLIPISAEGPFPKWSQRTRFLAQGSGDREKIDGQTYKMYTMGRNLDTRGPMFSTCKVYVSEETKRLVVQGVLAADRQHLINHSGTYDHIRIERPNIVPLPPGAKIEDIDHQYVRARGHLLKDGQFKTPGITFAVDVWKEGEFEIIGYVYKRSNNQPLLQASSYKRIAAR